MIELRFGRQLTGDLRAGGERELALVRGRPAVGIVHRVVRSGAGPVRLEFDVLGTWRDIHGERFAGPDPAVEPVEGGFVFEGARRMRGPGFEPAGSWYRGARHRAEAERGLNPLEDLWHCGRFTATVAAGDPAGAPARSAVAACRPLVTSLGLRSLAPGSDGYTGRHRGGPAERDRAYHQGTVWPWLIGPWVEAATKVGADTTGALDGLEAHLGEWGLGSVWETADGDAPHAATGCPFQAWSVAQLLRARGLLAAG